MELKLDLISRAHQSLSPGGDRTISLRDSRVSVIANLGATKDGYDCIDLSNNDILKLENFPLLPRLRTLIVAGNRISKISPELSKSVPNVTSLVLTGNCLAHLSDLGPLFKLSNLERLSLLDNPVIAVPHFREYVVYRLPRLRFLNFCKVTQKERDSCAAFFKKSAGAKLLREQGYDPSDSTSGGKSSNELLAMVESASDMGALLKLEKQLLNSSP